MIVDTFVPILDRILLHYSKGNKFKVENKMSKKIKLKAN